MDIENLSDEEVIDKINELSHEELVRMWRFAPVGFPLFDCTKPFYEHVRHRLFTHFGGVNCKISKKVGWG